MSKQEIYFLDTIKATKNYDSIIGAIDLNYYHSYNISFPLRYPLKDLKSIALKSVEMPISLPTIRFNNSTEKVGFTFSYSTYTRIYKHMFSTRLYTRIYEYVVYHGIFWYN